MNLLRIGRKINRITEIYISVCLATASRHCNLVWMQQITNANQWEVGLFKLHFRFQIPYHDRSELLLDQKNTILPWLESWRRRLTRFAVRQDRGKCDELTENAYSKARINSAERRNLLRHRSVIPTLSSQSLTSVEAQPRTPRHYYPPDSQLFQVNPAPVAPSWSQSQYRSMRYADPSPQQLPLSWIRLKTPSLPHFISTSNLVSCHLCCAEFRDTCDRQWVLYWLLWMFRIRLFPLTACGSVKLTTVWAHKITLTPDLLFTLASPQALIRISQPHAYNRSLLPHFSRIT